MAMYYKDGTECKGKKRKDASGNMVAAEGPREGERVYRMSDLNQRAQRRAMNGGES